MHSQNGKRRYFGVNRIGIEWMFGWKEITLLAMG
jgi:hypothetical protein